MDASLPTTDVSGPPNLYPGFAHFSLRALVPDSPAPCQVRLEAYNPAYSGLRLVRRWRSAIRSSPPGTNACSTAAWSTATWP